MNLRLILPLLFAAALHAQQQPPPATDTTAPAPAAPVPKQTPPAAYLRTLGMDCAPEGLLHQVGSNAVPLSVPLGIRSDYQGYGGENPLILFRQVNGTDGKISNQPVLSVDLSRGGKLPLIVFHKGAGPTSPPVVTIYPEDPSAFPGDTFRFMNEGKSPLAVRSGGTNLLVPPMDFRDLHGKAGVSVVEIFSISGTNSKILFNSNVGMRAGRRVLMIAGPPPVSGAPVIIQRLDDAPEAPAAH